MKYTFFHKPLAYFPKKRTIGIKMEILFWHIFIEINQNTFYNSCYKIRHLYMWFWKCYWRVRTSCIGHGCWQRKLPAWISYRLRQIYGHKAIRARKRSTIQQDQTNRQTSPFILLNERYIRTAVKSKNNISFFLFMKKIR